MSDALNYGEQLFNQGQLAEARNFFWLAVEECPGNAMAWNNLAVVAQAEGDPKAAENYLKKALEIRPNLWEARFNLAQLLMVREKWAKAAGELRQILEIRPGDLPAVKLLAEAYFKMKQPEEGRRILELCDQLGSLKGFIDSLWLGIKYFTLADNLSVQDRLEGLTAAFLKLIDGQNGRTRKYKLMGSDFEGAPEVVLENLYDMFYYKEQPSLTIPREPGQSELVLTVGEHQDWLLFHKALQKEMRAEGGCLGDFTQTKKVFKQEPALSRYSFQATLDYFRANLGPCDCHVLRAAMV